jgi:hypothetical protein
MNEQLLVTCKTCRYYNDDLRSCDHSSANINELSNRCLQKIKSENFFMDNWKHPRYPYLTRKYNVHEYFYWEPKEQYIDNVIEKFFNKEDFEI